VFHAKAFRVPSPPIYLLDLANVQCGATHCSMWCRALKSRQSGSLEGGDDDGMQDPSGLNLTKTEAGENAQVNRPAARKTGKAAAAAGARQPGQRSTTSKKGSGGGSAASGVAQKPRQNFVRMDKKVTNSIECHFRDPRIGVDNLKNLLLVCFLGQDFCAASTV
jgi:hypothetical protein